MINLLDDYRKIEEIIVSNGYVNRHISIEQDDVNRIIPYLEVHVEMPGELWFAVYDKNDRLKQRIKFSNYTEINYMEEK